jgi:GWxTD domain-containing protein
MTPEAQELHVTLYRSWHPPNATVVHRLFRVDGEMLGTGSTCEYHVRLWVEDSTGTRLVNNEWDGRCPPAAADAPPAALETFEFAVLPSRYTVNVSVEPKGKPDARISTKVPLESLPTESLASDLILARRAGWVDSATDVQWTIRKGKLGIAASSEAVALETSPSIAYYLELYPRAGKPVSGTLVGVIRRPDGRQIAQLQLQRLQDVAESRPLAGNVSLAGLAPGEYVLETRLSTGDTTLVRTHPFRMEGRILASPETPSTAGGSYFSSLTDQQLTELFDPVLASLQKQADRDLYERLSPDGRRRFLQEYFGGVSPTPGGQGTNPLDLYLRRVQHVNREYAGRGGEPGWRTDRGKIYLIRGEPQNKSARPLPPGGASPYEIWVYNVAPGYYYVFVDESRIGSYRLILTSDPAQPSLPDWERRLSNEVFEDMFRMGVRPARGQNSP